MGKEAQNLTAEQRINLLELELKQAKAENTQLRNALHQNTRHTKRIEQAYQDALLLAQLHIGYEPTSRNAGSRAAISRRRWTNAMALLKLARVYNCRKFIAHSLVEVEPALQRAKRIATENPTSYLARLPRHADDKNYRHGKFADQE